MSVNFVDSVHIQVKAGDGGNGAVAFRREKFVPRGGPAGGDGGRGGSVILIADRNLTTLLDFRYHPHQRARNGEHGKGSDCNGRDADDLRLHVPVGTLIKDALDNTVLCDLAVEGQEFVVAKAGRGGLGNMNFATATRQAPRFAQPGELGEELEVVLELKLLADVGLIGYPNAGKSTFISRVSRARPKVADYPFTTLTPHLGVVQYKDEKSFVIADIPGLIEGAHTGAGLGHQFLRHVERCRTLIHLVDCSAEGEGRSPERDYEAINRELALHSPELAKKPQIVAANKVDLPEARDRAEAFQKAMKARGARVILVSGATGEGLQEVLDRAAQIVLAAPKATPQTVAEMEGELGPSPVPPREHKGKESGKGARIGSTRPKPSERRAAPRPKREAKPRAKRRKAVSRPAKKSAARVARKK